MRVLCVGRHEYLSEHLCRFFRDLGAECTGVVGSAAVVEAASRFHPQVVVSDCDLLTTALLEVWTSESCLANVPVLAVSLTRRPDESLPEVIAGVTGVVYLPALDRDQVRSLLDNVNRLRAAPTPAGYGVALPQSAVAL